MPASELVAAAVAGDHSAFAEIYDRYADQVHAVCLERLGDPAAAAAATGHVFFLAVHRLAGLREPGLLEPWLLAIADRQLTGLHGTGAGTDVPAAPAPPQLREEALEAFDAWTSAGGAGQVARIGAWRRDGFPRRPVGRRTIVIAVMAGAALLLVAGTSIAFSALSATPGSATAAAAPAPGSSPGSGLGPLAAVDSTDRPATSGSPVAADNTGATVTATSSRPSTSGPTATATTSTTTGAPSSAAPSGSESTSTPTTSDGADPGALSASPAVVSIAATAGATADFTLSHTGTVAVSFTVATPDGLSAAPASGRLTPGVPVTIVLTIDPSTTSATGGTVTVTSPTAGSTRVAVEIVKGGAELSATELSNPLGIPQPTTATFELSNTGSAATRWGATTSRPWLGVTPEAGSLDPGETVVITVSIAPDPTPVATAKLERVTIKAPGSTPVVVKVPLTSG